MTGEAAGSLQIYQINGTVPPLNQDLFRSISMPIIILLYLKRKTERESRLICLHRLWLDFQVISHTRHTHSQRIPHVIEVVRKSPFSKKHVQS